MGAKKGDSMTYSEKKNQLKLACKLRRQEILRKEKAMQARTGAANLSSSYSKIQRQLQNSMNQYKFVVDLNRAQSLLDDDNLEAA